LKIPVFGSTHEKYLPVTHFFPLLPLIYSFPVDGQIVDGHQSFSVIFQRCFGDDQHHPDCIGSFDKQDRGNVCRLIPSRRNEPVGFQSGVYMKKIDHDNHNRSG